MDRSAFWAKGAANVALLPSAAPVIPEALLAKLTEARKASPGVATTAPPVERKGRTNASKGRKVSPTDTDKGPKPIMLMGPPMSCADIKRACAAPIIRRDPGTWLEDRATPVPQGSWFVVTPVKGAHYVASEEEAIRIQGEHPLCQRIFARDGAAAELAVASLTRREGSQVCTKGSMGGGGQRSYPSKNVKAYGGQSTPYGQRG